MDWCPLRALEWHLNLLRQQRLRPAQATSFLVATIRKQDHAEVTAFAKAWPKGAEAYPHLAAGATLQRYVGTEGIPAAEPILLPPAAQSAKGKVKAKAKPKAKRKPGRGHIPAAPAPSPAAPRNPARGARR